MISSLLDSPLTEPPPVLSEEHIECLAHTYDRVSAAIWIHDLQERCVYRNPSAQQSRQRPRPTLVFDIVDHQGRTVARLQAAFN